MNHLSFHNDTVSLNDLWYESHKQLIENIAIELDMIDKIEDLTNKFLGEKQKLKKIIDPKKPKRAKSSYLYFCDSIRDNIKKESPNIKIGDLMKKIGVLWKDLSKEKRGKFEDMHAKDKERYEDEMEAYNLNH